MALASAVQGARHTAQAVTWTGQDLTGVELTGVIYDARSEAARAIDGELTITDAAAGVFSWRYGAADVATAGTFRVQFAATYDDGQTDKSLLEAWTVAPGPEAE